MRKGPSEVSANEECSPAATARMPVRPGTANGEQARRRRGEKRLDIPETVCLSFPPLIVPYPLRGGRGRSPTRHLPSRPSCRHRRRGTREMPASPPAEWLSASRGPSIVYNTLRSLGIGFLFRFALPGGILPDTVRSSSTRLRQPFSAPRNKPHGS